MNWGKALIAGVVGGFVGSIVNFVMHGLIMASAYVKYPVFTKEEANPVWFIAIAICVGIMAALLFAKSRVAWGDGWLGGVNFGFWVGLVFFFEHFYDPLVLEGFPYHLGWCWGGINLILFMVMGAIFGLIYKK